MVLNTEWAQVEVIDLINDGSGLAFGIIGGRSTGVVVKTILPGGVADRDGRLQSGDHILQIGDVNLRGLGSEQVASVLRQCGVHVRMVVARPVEPTSPDYRALGSHAPIVPTKLLGDPEELDRHLVEHGYSETFSHGNTQPYEESYIYSRTHSDLEIHPVSSVVDIVKNPLPIGPAPIIPTEREREPSIELLPLDMALHGPPTPETETFTVELRKDDYGLGITVAGYVCEKEELSGIFVKSVSKGSAADLCGKIHVNDRIVQVDGRSLTGHTNHQAVEVLRNTGSIVRLSLERYLRGPKYEQLQEAIRANQLKPPSPPSPSISSLPKYTITTDGYSYTEIDLEGESHTTMTSSVLVDQTTPVNEETEIVIDNPCPLHVLPTVDSAIANKWKNILERDIQIVVANLIKDSKGGLGISLEGTVDVEDGREVRPHHYIRSILPDGPVGINRVLEAGDELLEVNGLRLLGLNHLEVVRILKTLPQHVLLVCARHSEHSAPHRIINTSQDRAAFATRSILGGSLQNLLPLSEQCRLVKAKSDSSLASSVATIGELSGSRSKSRSLEPVTGLAAWSDDLQIIELNKGDRGLGFSILDYQDPLNPNETVILIRSLVPGGVAQSDGRLIPGDRLMAVNDTPLARATLEQAVQALKGASKGVVRIAVAKPLPCNNDTVSQSSQECINDDDADDHTCLEDYHECLEEYQEGIEVVQICVDDSDQHPNKLCSPEDAIQSVLYNNNNALSDHNKPTLKPEPLLIKITERIPKEDKENIRSSSKSLTKKVIDDVKNESIFLDDTKSEQDIELKYKQEVSNCLRVSDQGEDKDGYETCLEEIDSPDLSRKSIPEQTKTTPQTPDPVETKIFSKKDHISLEDKFSNDELKSYDDQTESFGGDQFFLVEYIDADPISERLRPTESFDNDSDHELSYRVLTKDEHDRKYNVKNTVKVDVCSDESLSKTLDESSERLNTIEIKTEVVATTRTPRRYVRCLSEYYNDYEECLEEYRMYSQMNFETIQTAVGHTPVRDEDDQCITEKEMSEGDLCDLVSFSPRSSSAPDILDSSYNIKMYDPGPEFDQARRKSTAVPEVVRDTIDGHSMTVTRVIDGGMGPDESNVIDGHWGPPRIVQVSRPPVGSLGISIVGGKVDLYNAESVLGIFIKNVVPQSPAGLTGELKTGDRILEVDGTDLRKASHEKAVEAIRSAGNPVQFLVQSLMPWGNDLDNQNLPHSEITNNNIIRPSPTPSARSSRKSPAPKSPASLLSRESLPDETDQILNPSTALSNSQKSLLEEEIPPRPTSALSNHPKINITDTTLSIDQAEAPAGDNEQNSTDQVNKTDEEAPAVKQKYSDDESDESSDEEDTRDLEGRTYSEKGQEIDRASAGNVKRTKDEIDADPEEEDEFGYTSNKVKKKYNSLGGAVMMVQLERGTQGLGLSLAGHRDRNCMAVFVVGLNPSGSAHRLGPAGIQVGDEILEVNGIVLHGRCHLNASAIIKGLSGPVFKVIVLRRKSALDDLAVKPITQFPISLDEETPEEKYSNFKNVRTVTIKKGTQSLGIMIIEGKHAEVGQGIFISDIQEGSAAEQAGLDIGDMILAVNKDSLLGSSYDSAASLLKRTEGLVTLVVCNPTKKDKDATETADAKSSSRTGSRPPSAADKAGLKTSAPPSRPTTPISEPVADPATCPIVPGKETYIEVATESKPLGLSYVGGKETLIPSAIIVHEIYPNGALAKDNRLKAGDQLLEVNGEKLADVPALTAMGVLRQILPKFKMTVFRPEKPETTTIDVELTKKPGKGLGLSIMARKSEPGVYVADILHGGVADLDKRIMKGDIVVSVNGQDLTNSTAEQAGAALKTASGRVNIKLSRHKPVAR